MCMDELLLSKQILLKLVVEDIPFASILRTTFKKNDINPVSKANITALIGCELRHHYIFDNLIKRFIDEAVEFEKTINLRFYLSNHLFLRRFDDASLFSLACSDLGEEVVKNIVNFVDSTNEIIPDDLDKASPEYLSMRYNTPSWVVRMWQKQYGKGLVFKVLKVNYRRSVPSIRVNENQITVDEFLAKHPDFSVSPVEGMVIYQGKGNAKYIPEFKENKVFFIKMATKVILDKLDLSPLKKIAIYSETPNNIYLDLLVRFGKNYPIDYIVNHSATLTEARKIRTALELEKLYLYEANYEGLITCLSTKVDTFICLPKSSILDLLRSTPDYFLRIKQDELDSLIANEENVLEECSKFVNDDGELVYMVPTLSRKESNALIANFLIKHPEYSLIEEQQFFPFESYDSCMYFARLKKNNE